MGWYNILSKLTIGASVLCESLQYLVNMSTELYVFLDSLDSEVSSVYKMSTVDEKN